MSYELSEEQQLIQQNAREFAQDYLGSITVQLDKSDEYPADAVRRMAELGFLGFCLPEEFGGAAVGYLGYVLAVEELAKVSAAVASILIEHASLAAYAMNRWGTTAQKQEYLPVLARGEKLGAFALNESGPAVGIGPDAVIATAQSGGYVLNGRKCYVGNAGVAGLYVIFACTDAAAGAKTLTAFIVPADTPGISVGPKKAKMGLHGFPTADVVLKNVVVSESRILGSVNAGQAIAAETMAAAAIAQAAQAVGITQKAVEHGADYAKQRVQFGRPVASFQAVQTMLAEAAVNCHVARLAVYSAASLVEQGKPFEVEAAMVKLFTARFGQKSLVDIVQVEGGNGYSEEVDLARLYREISGVTILEGPMEFPEKLIASAIAGGV
jgi:alkylation response protein AidB-like acyl-CoA dehydrogenase